MTVSTARTRTLAALAGTAAAAIAAAAVSALAWPPAAPAVAAALRQDSAALDDVLVSGEPPLTRTMVRDYGNFLCYLIDAPLTAAQRDYVRDALVADWRKQDATEIQGTLDTLDAYRQIRELPEDQQKAAVPLLQKEVLTALRAAKGKDPHARWLLAIYDTAHKPLAKGKAGAPALTRQVTDAYLEVTAFQIAQAAADRASAKVEVPPLDTPTRDGWAKGLAAAYPKLSATEQKELSELPLAWAALRIAWPQMSDAEREKARRGWRQAYAPQLALAKKEAEKAERAERAAKAKAAAASSSAGGTKPGRLRLSSSSSSLRNSIAVSNMMAAQQNMMNFQQQMHYSRMNMTANLGNSSYRYVNGWGVPY